MVPLAQGGADELDNLVSLCAGCHAAEHGRAETAERRAWREYAERVLRGA